MTGQQVDGAGTMIGWTKNFIRWTSKVNGVYDHTVELFNNVDKLAEFNPQIGEKLIFIRGEVKLVLILDGHSSHVDNTCQVMLANYGIDVLKMESNLNPYSANG